MPKNKLQRYAELATLANVFESAPPWRGSWAQACFQNSNPIVLELACGKGEYSRALAARFSDKNFIGVDVKGARVWKGARAAIADGAKNVAFVRAFIQFLPLYFAPGEISEIWITFPDPFIKKSDANKRLTSTWFLNLYNKLLVPGGRIHLKTDSDLLFQFTLDRIQEHGCHVHRRVDDIGLECRDDELLQIRTYFELKHLAASRRIHYICFSLPAAPPDGMLPRIGSTTG